MARGERTIAFRMLAGALIPPLKAVGRYQVTGTEHIPATGAFVCAANHFTNIDPAVIGMALWEAGRPPHYLAKEPLFRVPVFGWLLRATGQVPVVRSGAIRGPDPVAAARTIADDGGALVVFPEGSLTRDPALWPMRGKTGAVRIALDAGIPIVPAVHWGDQAILGTYGRRISFFPRKPVQIRFGPAVDLSPWRGRALDQAVLRTATDAVMAAITALLEQLRGEPAPAERWDPVAHHQSEIGRIEPR
ncbi:MAG: lysophospholipid acyltransferase family protein [Microbacteriaceae bacterium]